jgi:hypothetical protein
MTIVFLLIYRFHSHSFKLWVTLIEGLWLVFPRRMDIAATDRRNLEDRGMLEHNNVG